jgi:hypothetical protein
MQTPFLPLALLLAAVATGSSQTYTSGDWTYELNTSSAGGNGRVEKIANYAIYPRLGAGFSLIYAARMGMPDLAELSGQDKSWPLGSASVLRLKQYKE